MVNLPSSLRHTSDPGIRLAMGMMVAVDDDNRLPPMPSTGLHRLGTIAAISRAGRRLSLLPRCPRPGRRADVLRPAAPLADDVTALPHAREFQLFAGFDIAGLQQITHHVHRVHLIAFNRRGIGCRGARQPTADDFDLTDTNDAIAARVLDPSHRAAPKVHADRQVQQDMDVAALGAGAFPHP